MARQPSNAAAAGGDGTLNEVVNGIMDFTSPATPNNVVVAVDLRTQKTLWRYEHKNAPVSTALRIKRLRVASSGSVPSR